VSNPFEPLNGAQHHLITNTHKKLVGHASTYRNLCRFCRWGRYNYRYEYCT